MSAAQSESSSEAASSGADGAQTNSDADGANVDLGSSATDTLEQGQALPGESTESDVDAILEETERRFEEAQRKIDETYKQAEATSATQGTPDSEGQQSDTGDGEASAPSVPDPVEEPVQLEGSSEEVDAILQETERRFEEAKRKIDETFEQAERQVPEEVPADADASFDADVNAEGDVETRTDNAP